jgi:hypothetical protein
MPNHPLRQNTPSLLLMQKSIETSANVHRLPVALLLAVVYRESSFLSTARGESRGEIGLTQVHGVAARHCDLSTVPGQLDCGASWLRYCISTCGNIRRGLTAYATGKCRTTSTKVTKKIESRIRLWKRIETMFYN